ncbi:MAG: hypothetical protein KGZ71_09680 [Desulfobulbaceae bacterium]|nr:hypothetical protein [Desulfobulbaceae bacterium]
MAREQTIRFLRTTLANLNTQASANNLKIGEPYFVTDIEKIAVGKTVSSYVLYAISDHNHSGVYEPADATILKDADIGVSVAAQSHNHAASEITSGTLDIARVPTITVAKGGTNQTSYTKGDILAASSSSVLTKLGVGANDTVLMADSAQSTGMKWGTPAGGAGITVYSVTTADAENTASEIDVISFTVPANTWKNGETITINFNTRTKQFAGATRTLNSKAYVQGNLVIHDFGGVNSTSGEGNTTREIKFTRAGTVMVAQGNYATPGIVGAVAFSYDRINSDYQTTDTNSRNSSRFTTIDFTASIIIKLAIQWSAAHANTYYRILDAIAYKLNS